MIPTLTLVVVLNQLVPPLVSEILSLLNGIKLWWIGRSCTILSQTIFMKLPFIKKMFVDAVVKWALWLTRPVLLQ
jgi:hypothetical protein